MNKKKSISPVRRIIDDFIRNHLIKEVLEFLIDFLKNRCQSIQFFTDQLEQYHLLFNNKHLYPPGSFKEKLKEMGDKIRVEVEARIPSDVFYVSDPLFRAGLFQQDFQIVVEKINSIIRTNGITPAIPLLKAMLCNKDKLANLELLIEDYNTCIWQLKHKDLNGHHRKQFAENNGLFKQWEERISWLERRLVNFVKKIREQDVIIKWKTVFYNKSLGLEPIDFTPKFNLFSGTDLIHSPLQITNGNNSHKYRLSLNLFRDAFQAGDFDLAYQYCKKVQTEIESESAQLYEGLMISFLKDSTADRLIEQALGGNNKNLYQLFAYCNKFQELQERGVEEEKHHLQSGYLGNIKIPPAISGSYNLKQISTGLLMSLQNAYSKINLDYTQQVDPTTTQEYHQLTNLIRLSTSFANQLPVNLLFVEMLVNELSGGNKNNWLTIDQNGAIQNLKSNSIDALEEIAKLKRLLQFRYNVKPYKSNQILSRSLLFSLDQKYDLLKQESQNNNITHPKLLKARLYKLLLSYWTGYRLFGNKNFLDTPIIELLKKDGILSWFTLSEEAELIASEDIDLKGYYPVKLLSLLITEKRGEEHWTELKELMISSLAKRLNESADQLYANIAKKARKFIVVKDPRTTQQLIDCFSKWKICYLLSQDQAFIHKIVDELLGNQLFYWFKVDEDLGFQVPNILKQLTFDPFEWLRFIIQQSSKYKTAHIICQLTNNYFDRILLTDYEQVSKTTYYAPRNSSASRKAMYRLLKTAVVLYVKGYKNERFAKFLFDELLEEKNFSWLHLKDCKIVSNTNCEKLGLHPAYLLETIKKELLKGTKFTDKYILDKIIEKRYAADLTDYTIEFLPQKRKNKLISDRERMVALFNRLKDYYKLTGNLSYLGLLREEILDGKGKIKWLYTYSLSFNLLKKIPLTYIEIQHSQNFKIEGFNYFEERKYLQELIKTKTTQKPGSGQFRKRWRKGSRKHPNIPLTLDKLHSRPVKLEQVESLPQKVRMITH